MTESFAFDVIIGLVFISPLYSLLATIVQEIVAVWIGLRTRLIQATPFCSEYKRVG